MRALVKVGYRCNQRCAFCHCLDARGVEAGGAEVDARIDRAAQLGHSMVVLSGGEVTLRPELLGWAARVAARGMDLGLVTNGALLDGPLLDRLVPHRLRYVQLSLHGGSAEVHDGLAGAPSFGRVLGALGALAGRGLEVWVNCVVTRPNLDRLAEVVAAVAPFAGASLKFSMVEARGAAAGGFDDMVPRVTEVAARVRAAVELARRTLGAGRRVAHDGIPFCLLPGLEELRGDLRAHGFTRMAEVGEPDLFPVDERNALHPPRCRPCALRGRCPGLYLGYHARHGDAELAPLTSGARSNSFNYVYEGRLVGADAGGACPVEAVGVEPWERGRHLFVQHGDRIARFHAASRDFTDADVEETKLALGQVYLDVSGKDAPDDFETQLVKLRRAGRCASCGKAARCTGLFEPVLENLFRADDARVLELLRALRGDVLDVGCGEGPYGDALAEGVLAGRIRYTGVEPDAGRAARMRERWPWARVVEASAETLPLDGARFDHVLVLRSWNHLADPAGAAARLVDALRPGGTLTVVDNVAFGLARTRGHARRAERSDAAIEHRRNDGGAEALALLAEAGVARRLTVLERRDVGPGTSNQWLLRFSRRAPLRYELARARGRLAHPLWSGRRGYFPVASVHTGSACNVRCVYCNVRGGEEQRLASRAELERTIDVAAEHLLRDPREPGHPTLELIGGEPTVHPDLAALIARGRAAGFPAVTIVTNGTLLARPGYLDSLVAAGLTGVRLSLHHERAEVAGALAGAPAMGERYPMVARALLARADLDVQFFRIALASTIATLTDTVRFLADGNRTGRAVELVIALPAMRGRALDDPALHPPLEALRSRIGEAVALGRQLGLDVLVHHAPGCLEPEAPERNLCWHVQVSEVDELGVRASPPGAETAWARACEGCSGREGGCAGIPRVYWARDAAAVEAWVTPLSYRPETEGAR
jgi:MoaA/NifB/PqqE/SkfB family radical SAM enzyme/SAM-dependent methyltransferase